MKHINHFKKCLLPALAGILILLSSTSASAQCNPTYTGNPCVGTIINFKSNAPGYTTWHWEFGNLNTSDKRDPAYAFPKPGTYMVKMTASNTTLGTCKDSFEITVLPSPEVNIKLLSSKEQCFDGNSFCFRDSSIAAPGSSIIRATYLFEDADLYETTNPSFPRDFCKDHFKDDYQKSILDERGGWFDLHVELEDANGCISKIDLDSVVRVFPKLGIKLDANGSVGCDSTEGVITNVTYLNWLTDPERNIGLKDVASFVFDFGDGPLTTIYGDSVTNTEYWTGTALDGIIKKKYYATGTFDATLSVTSVHGCSESFTYRAAATNYNYSPVIVSEPDSSCNTEPAVFFSLKDGPIPGASWEWNFGNPPSGTFNKNRKSWTPVHDKYGSGPYMISLNIKVGPCDLWAYDTIIKVGPTSTIEIPDSRVPVHERFQCQIEDSVHFVNNSTFYHDDAKWQDEDSMVWFYTKYDTINGKVVPTDSFFHFVFDYDPVTHDGSQVILPNDNQIRNKDHVLRIWTLGDNYAPGCTTDTKANKNVNLNCNYTLDSLPVHWYTPWDEIYYTYNRGNFYKKPVEKTIFSRNSRSCFEVSIYADSIVYIPARLTIGYPENADQEIKSDSFLHAMFQKHRQQLFTLTYGSTPDTVLDVAPYDTVYIYVPSGSKVVNRSGATGDIFDMNSTPATGVNDATGPGYFRVVGKSFGSSFKLESGSGFDVMHADAEIEYDALRDCYVGPIIHTMTKHDQDFNLEAGTEVYVRDLSTGDKIKHTGPKQLTVEKDYQFEIYSNDSICPVVWSNVDREDRVVAKPSTYHKDTIINGVETYVLKNEVFIDAAYHRNYFYMETAECNSVTLWHKDTVHPLYCESSNSISLPLVPANARGLKWESGTPCVVVPGAPFNPNYYLTFSMDDTKPGCTQKWFEVNYDTLACDTCWIPYNSGGVLAPTAPGNPGPFVAPYIKAGAPPTKFIKAYTPNQVNIPGVNRLNGSFGLGLIIGNGPPRYNSAGQEIPPECMDTAYYADMFRIKYMDPTFDVIIPTGLDKKICVGESAYLRVRNPIQEEIKQFAMFWNVDDGTDEDLTLKQGAFVETYNYFKEYKGPVSGRNDQDVVWDPSQKWLYTYLEQDNYTFRKKASANEIEPYTERDTLVTRIYREWEVRANNRNVEKEIENGFKSIGLDIRDIDPADIPLYLGDGTFGCIDTTGYGDLFEFYIAPIEKNVVTHGKYKYRYTDHNQTDSVIIEEVLHYRDSSLRGNDTAIAPYAFTVSIPGNDLSYKKGDKIPDLYTMNFKYPVLIPDPCDPNAPATLAWDDVRGLVHTYVAVENLDGCQSSNSRDIFVGFFHQNKMAETAVCKGSPHIILDSVRYFTNDGFKYAFTYPVDPTPFWEDPARFAIKELKYVDWDANDGKADYETSISFSHIYDYPGTYKISYAMRDSNMCVDTVQLTAYVTGIKANFETNLQQLACQNIITFFDSTVVFDPCRGLDTCQDRGYEPCDSIIAYEWDFGDGSRTSVNPKTASHNYTSSGWFTVKMKVWSALGCVDSVEKQIFIPGPQPEFAIQNTPWGPDSIIICVGESVELSNLSGDPMFNPDWLMYWGDGATDGYKDINDPMIHVYDSVGVFYLSLLMNDSVPGISQRCIKLFPDTSNLDGKSPRRIKVIVMPVSPASFVPRDTVVCPNEPILFMNTSDEIYTRLLWSFGDGDTITKIRATDGDTIIHTYPNAGTYQVTLQPDYDLAPEDFGPKCLDTASGTVTVTEVVADFSIDSAQFPLFCFHDASLNATKWSWTFQDQDGDHFSSDQNPCYDWGERIGSYVVCLAVENADGCTDTICKPIRNIFRTVIVPYNVFTPNDDDDLNQKFVIDVESHEEYNIKIYNRWGETVFESDDPANPWDGTIMNDGQECPAGTYFYIINYKLRGREFNDGLGPIEGTVTLFR